jgi:MoaA/NifB/PqqE/SkfB family radical SAM enzyme
MIVPTLVRNEAWGKIEYDGELDEFSARVCQRAAAIVDRPLSAGCLVTGRCNLACAFCYGNFEALPKVELSLEQWVSVFARLKSWGLMRADISGGEPTVRSDIHEILRASLYSGLNTVLSTNGYVRGRDLIEKLPREIRLHVSLDSGFAEIHEASRVLRNLKPSYGSFEATLQFIRAAVELGFRVRILTCLGNHNRAALFQLGEILARIGVKEWNLSRVLPAGRALMDFESRWKIANDEAYAQVQDLREAFPCMRIRFTDRTGSEGYFLLVLPDGELATQYFDRRDKVVLGSSLSADLSVLQNSAEFSMSRHARKWIASVLPCSDENCGKCSMPEPSTDLLSP